MPDYLLKLFETIFQAADRDRDGELSTIELMQMLKKRAKGTALDGDAHAIFTLRTLLSKQASSDNGEIGVKEFARGLMKTMLTEPNGHVAEWILKELQSEAEEWSTHEHEGRTYFRYDVTHETQWDEPEILIEMRRCRAEAGGGGADG